MSLIKTIAVINSCETVEQLESAANYVELYLDAQSQVSEYASRITGQIANQLNFALEMRLIEITSLKTFGT